ncbi:MAG: type 4a pilus biogenesis protein PilO [Candidatus Omnitrophica bacterium]|nr:type 4a pilus biogenesis protein PilO [Candidatus Omnitrophota bacterium]
MSDIKESINKLKNSLDKRQMQFIIYGLAIFVVILVLLIAHRPLALRLSRTKNYLNSLDGQLISQRKAIDSLKKIDLAKDLMKQKDVSLAIDDITAYGGQLGLKFISITPADEQSYEEGNFSVLPIELKLECDYRGLGQFLVYIEEFPLTVGEVAAFSVRPKGALAKLDVDMTVKLYMEPE